MFYLLAFTFSWILWTPGILTNLGIVSMPDVAIKVLFVLGGISPAVSAFIITGRTRGKEGIKQLVASSYGAGRKYPVWIILSIVLLIVHWSAAAIFSRVTGQPAISEMIKDPVGTIIYFVILFFVGGGLGEEIGWRGFALPGLQKRFSPFAASLILSSIWIIWHLPLFYQGHTNQALIPFWLFILSVYPLGIILTYLFNKTGAVFAAAFFHSLGNLAMDIFPVIPTERNPDLWGMGLIALFYSIFAAALLIIGRKTFFTKQEEVAS